MAKLPKKKPRKPYRKSVPAQESDTGLSLAQFTVTARLQSSAFMHFSLAGSMLLWSASIPPVPFTDFCKKTKGFRQSLLRVKCHSPSPLESSSSTTSPFRDPKPRAADSLWHHLTGCSSLLFCFQTLRPSDHSNAWLQPGTIHKEQCSSQSPFPNSPFPFLPVVRQWQQRPLSLATLMHSQLPLKFPWVFFSLAFQWKCIDVLQPALGSSCPIQHVLHRISSGMCSVLSFIMVTKTPTQSYLHFSKSSVLSVLLRGFYDF